MKISLLGNHKLPSIKEIAEQLKAEELAKKKFFEKHGYNIRIVDYITLLQKGEIR